MRIFLLCAFFSLCHYFCTESILETSPPGSDDLMTKQNAHEQKTQKSVRSERPYFSFFRERENNQYKEKIADRIGNKSEQ